MKLKELEALAQATTSDPTSTDWYGADGLAVRLRRDDLTATPEEDAAYIAAHDPALMLRLYALLANAPVWHACSGDPWEACPGCVWEKKRDGDL